MLSSGDATGVFAKELCVEEPIFELGCDVLTGVVENV